MEDKPTIQELGQGAIRRMEGFAAYLEKENKMLQVQGDILVVCALAAMELKGDQAE